MVHWESTFEVGIGMGCLPFTQKIRKFAVLMGMERFFWFLQPEIFQN